MMYQPVCNVVVTSCHTQLDDMTCDNHIMDVAGRHRMITEHY